MNIWEVGLSDDKYTSIEFFNKAERKKYIIGQFRGNSMKSVWDKTIEVKINKNGIDTPCPSFYALTMNKITVSLFENIFDESVELLPIKLNNEYYYVINVIGCVDCLNFEYVRYLLSS